MGFFVDIVRMGLFLIKIAGILKEEFVNSNMFFFFVFYKANIKKYFFFQLIIFELFWIQIILYNKITFN